MRRIFVLINNRGIGGAELRLGRVFARMAQESVHAQMVVNSGLWQKLQAAGAVTGREDRIWSLPEPVGWLMRQLRWEGGVAGFWAAKLDYVFFASLVLCRYALAKAGLFHVALGGTYVVLGLMVLRPSHRFIISVTNPNLAHMVGTSWALPFYRKALGKCALIDALTPRVKADLIERGLDQRKIVVSPGSMVDVNHFQPLPDKEPWVVFAGRFIQEKNPLLFLEAVPGIHKAVPAARFFLFGHGPLINEVEQTVDRLRLREVVTVGFRSNLASVLGKSRVFVSLQRQDNYPSQSLLEAMSCGLASVATDVGLTWQLIDDQTGVRVKPEPKEITDAVIDLLLAPDRCRRLGTAARERVVTRHSEQQYRSYLDSQYLRLSMGTQVATP